MHINLSPPLVAKLGGTLRVLIFTRISSDKQDERSLDDQEVFVRRWILDRWDGEIEFFVISGIGSGERLDRKELDRAKSQIEANLVDIVVAEDLGRIMRRGEALSFCEMAEDYDTRVITINDNLDTGASNWRMTAMFSSLHHETHNSDASARIRRTVRNRFENGGALRPPISGYIHPPGVEFDRDVSKDPEWEAIYEKWFAILEEGATFADVADWLNSQSIRPRGSCRSNKWNGPMVGRLTRNPLLKGLRVHNVTTTRRENRTGRRRRVSAPPDQRLTRSCPHLQFIDPDRFDRLMIELAQRNAPCRRRKIDGRDPRKQVSKKRTRFPGQTIYCGVCGRMFVYGGHGREAHLMCQGARSYECWNGITCGEVDVRNRICESLFSQLEQLYDFNGDFLERILEQDALLHERENESMSEAQRELDRLDREINNLISFIRQGRHSDALAKELAAAETQKGECERRIRTLQGLKRAPLELPTASRLRELVLTSIDSLSRDSFEFARKMRQIIPKIIVFPYRLLDSDKVVFKAKYWFQPSMLLTNERTQPLISAQVDRVIELDFYDPPQREVYRTRVVELCRQMKVADAAAECRITKTAAHYALKLQKSIDELNLTDPYVPVDSPPAGSRKLRRHLHPRYQFNPLPGAGQF